MVSNESHPDVTIVRFGPLELNRQDPERAFRDIFQGLLTRKLVRRGVLANPCSIRKEDDHHIALEFRSPTEANNFVMTWTVCRYQPFAHVEAVQMDNALDDELDD
jgi:hypothetical protein